MHKDITKNLMDANLKEIERLARMNLALEGEAKAKYRESLRPAYVKSRSILDILRQD